MEESVSTSHGAALERVIALLDRVPGSEHHGLTPYARAELFSFLEHPSEENWLRIRNIRVTRTQTLRVAVMHHRNLRLHGTPSELDVLITLGALTP